MGNILHINSQSNESRGCNAAIKVKVTSRTADWLISSKMLSPDEAARWNECGRVCMLVYFPSCCWHSDVRSYNSDTHCTQHKCQFSAANWFSEKHINKSSWIVFVSITESETGTHEINIVPQSRSVGKRRQACFSGVISSFKHIHSAAAVSAVLFLSFMLLFKWGTAESHIEVTF